MDVRGGHEHGGDTVIAPAYGYESANARHDKTFFPVAARSDTRSNDNYEEILMVGLDIENVEQRPI